MRETTYLMKRSRVHAWLDSNFNTKSLRGCNFEVLPFLRVFPPGEKHYRSTTWTVHFGWLYWTFGVHMYARHDR